MSSDHSPGSEQMTPKRTVVIGLGERSGIIKRSSCHSRVKNTQKKKQQSQSDLCSLLVLEVPQERLCGKGGGVAEAGKL